MNTYIPSRGKTTPGSNSTSFKTPERSDSGITLGEPVVPIGDLLGDKHTLVIEPPAGDYPYDRVEISRGPDDENFTVIAVNEIDLVDDFANFVCERKGIDPEEPEAYEAVHAAVANWIVEGGGDRMNAILTDVYGGENDDARDWDMTQAIGFETTLAPYAMSNQILHAADASTQTEQFLEDYESGHFFREALVVQYQNSPQFPGGHMSDERYEQIVNDQIQAIIDRDNWQTSAAPQAPTRKSERDANEALVEGKDWYTDAEGAVNGRARAGDYVTYQVPGQQYPVEFEVLGMVQIGEGQWRYRVRNTDTGEDYEENLRGKFWKRADWMGDESREG